MEVEMAVEVVLVLVTETAWVMKTYPPAEMTSKAEPQEQAAGPSVPQVEETQTWTSRRFVLSPHPTRSPCSLTAVEVCRRGCDPSPVRRGDWSEVEGEGRWQRIECINGSRHHRAWTRVGRRRNMERAKAFNGRDAED
jgi:hypothetical protein